MQKIMLLGFLVPLSACTIGPDYQGPPRLQALGNTGAFLRADAASVAHDAPVARWWENLHDPELDALMIHALNANGDIAVARARLAQSRAQLGLDRADAAPSVSASPRFLYAHVPGLDLAGAGASSEDLTLYNLGFTASWEIDLFGGQYRAVEASRATMMAQQASLADVQVSLCAQLAQSYVDLRSLQHRKLLGEAGLKLIREQLDLTRQRFTRGTVAQEAVERQEAVLEEATAALFDLASLIERRLNALATLSGEQAGSWDDRLSRLSPLPVTPDQTPIGNIAAMIQRRPDIRASERKLAAATARIGAAKASAMPRLSFLGIIGVGGSSPGKLTDVSDMTALGMPTLQWGFLDFGRNRARLSQAKAARAEAAAEYEGVVLAAVGDAEDALSVFHYSRRIAEARARAWQAARRSAVLSHSRYDAGVLTRIDTIDSDLQRLKCEQAHVEALAGVTRAYIGLHKALGLGWSD